MESTASRARPYLSHRFDLVPCIKRVLLQMLKADTVKNHPSLQGRASQPYLPSMHSTKGQPERENALALRVGRSKPGIHPEMPTHACSEAAPAGAVITAMLTLFTS
eukprot:931785-Pelagomonas_calceolata.AAC.6